MKRKGAYLSLQLALVAVVIALIMTAVASLGIKTMDSYSDSEIRLKAEALDKALHLYSNDHKGIDASSLSEVTDAEGNKSLKYKSKRLYPGALATGQITELQNKFGLISTGIRFSAAITAQTPGIFRYTPITDASGDVSKYKLEVYLNNGTLYKSPNSAP